MWRAQGEWQCSWSSQYAAHRQHRYHRGSRSLTETSQTKHIKSQKITGRVEERPRHDKHHMYSTLVTFVHRHIGTSKFSPPREALVDHPCHRGGMPLTLDSPSNSDLPVKSQNQTDTKVPHHKLACQHW